MEQKKIRKILNEIEKMSESFRPKKGKFGDTEFDSEAVQYGYDLAISEVLQFLEAKLLKD
jgi:hypothetical protein